MKRIIFLAFLAFGCGREEHENRRTPAPPPSSDHDEIEKLKAQVLALMGTNAQINGLIQSDFATCPSSGDTADALINRICKVAQAANVEQIVAIKGQLSTLNDSLTGQLNAINDNLVQITEQEASDIASVQASIASINTQITSINGSITTLQTQMTSVQNAITALQTATAGINSTLSGTMTSMEIGTENLAAGPLYETILRRVDKTRINAYVNATGSGITVANNGASSTSGSPIVTITATSHGLSIGDLVHVQNLLGSNGFSNGDMYGDFTVLSVPTANTFTIQLRKNATSSGTFGGSNTPIAYKVIGRGMGTIWTSAAGADVAVRSTTGSSKAYNFIIKANGDVCYDKTNNLASFATINAGGANIVCK